VEFVYKLYRVKPDVVLMFTAGGLGFVEKSLYARLASLVGIPSFMWMVGGEFMTRTQHSPRYRKFAAVLLRWPTLLLSPGPTWQRFYSDVFGIAEERCPVIDSWVGDKRLFNIQRTVNNSTSSPVSIVFVGWVARGKGVFDLIAAALRLDGDPTLPDFRITFVGGGAALEEIREAVQTHGLARKVSVTGWITDAAKRDLLASADIFVLPSHAEGLPLALLEAMVVGLPVVTTPVGSIPDVVGDTVEGLLVPVRDSERLASALARLVRDPEERRRLGNAAAERAKAFSVETAVNQLDRLVTNVIDERKADV
jgi:glycosyltransferase involved in cell wall biosynthesis